MTAHEQQLRNLYYNATSSGGYGGVSRLYRAAKKANIPVTHLQVEKFLQNQHAYSLHKPTIHKLKTRKTYVNAIDQQWQADLADMQSLAKDNDGYRYILTCIDVLSKFAWVVPVKSKSASDMCVAMNSLFKLTAPRICKRLQTDNGKEFLNSNVQKLLKDKQIPHFTTYSDKKASVVERFNRTLKSRIWTYFTAHHKKRYVDVLQEIVDGYNQSYHRSIKMQPDQVTKENELQVWRQLFGNGDKLTSDKSVQKGDMVRITKWKDTFDKGYLQNWTDEHFVVDKRIPANVGYVYKLHDYRGEPIEGAFYKKEIQPIKRNLYYVESVVRERKNRQSGKKEFLVKWKGWSNDFNTWLSEEQVLASWNDELNNSTFTLPQNV